MTPHISRKKNLSVIRTNMVNKALWWPLYCITGIWIEYVAISIFENNQLTTTRGREFCKVSRRWKQRLTKKLPGQRDKQQARGCRMEGLCQKRYQEAVEGEQRREQLKRPANVHTRQYFKRHILAFAITMNIKRAKWEKIDRKKCLVQRFGQHI